MGQGWDALGWDRVSTLESWLMDRGSVGGNEGMTGTPAKGGGATRMSIIETQNLNADQHG
jgi:hypothetical protein